ncbi:uncharacterized protein LOC143242390 isoform X1 [Tachypleus tridentatus]|uniref:uncharacterized protein LOC143242390 isoform X1 n=1 Tax=Tachypleus tridentatus TaxID=6853 RepID=UPI003FD4EE91
MDETNLQEKIVLTPTKKSQGYTRLKLERTTPITVDDNNVVHVAGGDHKGIVINKKEALETDERKPPELTLQFKVFLTNATKNCRTKESRQLKLWFKTNVLDTDKMRDAQDFFRDLVSPCEFPKDYVGFIKKIMKLMQLKYVTIRKIEVELRQLEDTTDFPNGSGHLDEGANNGKLEEESILELIESAYPNPVSVEDLVRQSRGNEEEVHSSIEQLLSRSLIRCLGDKNYTRITQNDKDVKMVRQMPKVVSFQQPTIAIITSKYCEKVAVDSMIENKEVYFRYKTEGESHVYTLGDIGSHRVVATKLPCVGHDRSAMIAAGNTTTRLLGTFQNVEYVFLVGVGGGVPNYTDYKNHVRLGDVVVSAPTEDHNYIYVYCENKKSVDEQGSSSPGGYKVRTWSSPKYQLQRYARLVWQQQSSNDLQWQNYIGEAQQLLLDQEMDFSRPPSESDKLFMSVGGDNVIEVSHPQPPTGTEDPHASVSPVVHFGVVSSGRMSERLRFAHQHGIKAYDSEFDAVAESLCGNRQDNYIFIRGISDYRDGTVGKVWQPYAALVATAFMKAIINSLD